jgi:hypothetical protein
MVIMAEATFLFLKVSGDEAVKSASEVLTKLIGTIAAAPAAAESPAVELAPAPRLSIAEVPYEKPSDEPDGFALPKPKPARAVGVGCGGRSEATPFNKSFKTKPKKATKSPSNKPPGALALRILKLLDQGNGVAPLEVLVNELGASAQGLNMAITKCAQLKRLGDGRIALEGYSDSD